ncbi:MAG: hypothetical protein AAFP69_03510 [Planctomycetota bacterium]
MGSSVLLPCRGTGGEIAQQGLERLASGGRIATDSATVVTPVVISAVESLDALAKAWEFLSPTVRDRIIDCAAVDIRQTGDGGRFSDRENE